MSTEFPVTLKKGDNVRTANTPADLVAAQFDGFKEVHDVDIEPEDPSGFVVDPVPEVPAPQPTETRRERVARERAEREALEQARAAEQTFPAEPEPEVQS